MKGQDQLFSSNNDNWETPKQLIELIEQNHNILYDLAASEKNAICESYNDDLNAEYLENIRYQFHGNIGKRSVAYCNPPYSQCTKFVRLIAESEIPVIMLLPARTCTKWFHGFIYNKTGVRLDFIKGRLKFLIDGKPGISARTGKPLVDKKGNPLSAPFPSMLVYFRC